MIEQPITIEGQDATVLPSVNSNAVSTPDPATLIKTIASSSDPMGMLLSQLQAQGPSNPTAALISTFLQMRKPAEAAPASAEDPVVVEQDALAQQEREHSFQELKETVSRLYAELDVLRKRNDELAEAIGACFLCFGSDAFCPQCAGRGRPGSKLPDGSAYRKYVLPALRRTQSGRSNASGNRSPQNGATSNGTAAA